MRLSRIKKTGLSSGTAVKPLQRRVVMNAIGQPFAVSAEVGNFLGIGGRELIVRLDQLRPDKWRFVISLIKKQAEALPCGND